MTPRMIALTALVPLTLTACDLAGTGTANESPVTGLAAATTYDGLPVLSRDQLTLTIPGNRADCFNSQGQSFPCFIGYTADGIEFRFDTGIEGYRFREGQSDTITVERIDYDLGNTESEDLAATRYVLIP